MRIALTNYDIHNSRTNFQRSSDYSTFRLTIENSIIKKKKKEKKKKKRTRQIKKSVAYTELKDAPSLSARVFIECSNSKGPGTTCRLRIGIPGHARAR